MKIIRSILIVALFLVVSCGRFSQPRRLNDIAAINRACVAYSSVNQGQIPGKFSDMKTIPKSINLNMYRLVARGNIADYKNPSITVLVQEKTPDKRGKYATGYLDGHAKMTNKKIVAKAQITKSKLRKVRAVCDACGAWVEGKNIREDVVSQFSIKHYNSCGDKKKNTMIILYENDKKFESLKEDKREK